MKRLRNASKTRLYDSTPTKIGQVRVANSREGFVSWSDRGVLVFRPGTYTIPKPINEMTQKDLDACWTPGAPTKTPAKRNRKRLQPRKRPKEG